MRKIRLLLAEDHTVVREGIRRVVEQEADFEVVAEAGDGEEAVKLAVEYSPDVALVDIVMPKLNGIEATKEIKERCPHVAVLMLSAFDDDQFVFSFLEAGAVGYLLKSAHSRELVAAIRAVYEGKSVLEPSIIRKLAGHVVLGSTQTVPRERLGELSQRESEVLRLAIRGLSNREISQELGVSIRTVQSHFTHISKKMQVSSRTEALLRGLKEDWFNIHDVSLPIN